MADLERVDLIPMRYEPELGDCVPKNGRITEGLPQVFWVEGRPWEAACQYAVSKLKDSQKDIKTVVSDMAHLKGYATWLEQEEIDWRHFPMRKRERCLFRYRGHLIEQRDLGLLAPSTVSSRMSAVIRFYRWAQVYGWIERKELWEDRTKAVRFHTTVGLERTMGVLSSELSIPNRKNTSRTVEDGLVPIKAKNRDVLLSFLVNQRQVELSLMFFLGFLTGARSETIRTLRLATIEYAIDDDNYPGMKGMAVGPGTGVRTKFNVPGTLQVPCALMQALEEYAYSPRRAIRAARASEANKGLLFLTERGNPYSETSFTKLISRLRERLMDSGLKQFRGFKFHQTRATFGTQLMTLALENLPKKGDAIRFVRDAMFHKDESTTWKYVKFVEESPARERLSSEFFNLFTGASSSEEMRSLISKVVYE